MQLITFGHEGSETLLSSTPTQGSSASRDRVDGFITPFGELDAPADAIRQAEAPGLSHLEVGYAAAQRLVEGQPWPQGLFCPSDLMAYGTYRLASEKGIQIPQECRIVGVDDNAQCLDRSLADLGPYSVCGFRR